MPDGPGELDEAEQARINRILDLHALAAPTPEQLAELVLLEAEQVAVEAARTGPA